MTRSDVLADPSAPERLCHGGFLILGDAEAAARAEAAMPGFERMRLGGATMFAAPGTPRLRYEAHGRTLLVLGEVYDNDGAPVTEVLAALAAAPDLLSALADIDLGGRHALVAVSGDDIVAASDPFGSREIYYATGGGVALASHAPLLAAALGAEPDREVARFMAGPHYPARSVKYLPGDRSVVQDTRRLPPNHAYLSRTRSIRRFWPRAPREDTGEEAFFHQMDRALDALAAHLEGRCRPVVSITGGVDARCLLARFHARGLAFETVTWTNFNVPAEERPVIDAIAGVLGRPHHKVPSDKPPEHIRQLEEAAVRVSGGFTIGAPRTRVMARLAERLAGTAPPPVYVFGYGGEIIRGFYATEGRAPARAFTPGKMRDLYGVGPKARPEDAAFAIAAFRDFFARVDFSPDALKGYDPHDLFYWEHRMGMWAASTLVTVDLAMPSLVGLNSRRLFETALGLPDPVRLSKDLLRAYVARQSPDLAAIPVV